MRSNDFASQLVQLEAEATRFPNEATLLHRFLTIIQGMLDAKGLSVTVDVDAHEKRLQGRPDARIGSLIIEAKRPNIPVNEAIEQIQGRFNTLGSDNRLRGIAYNGHQIAFVLSDGSILCQGRPAELAGLLESWLVGLAITPAVPEDIVNLVGSSAGVARMAIRGFWEVFRQSKEQIGFVDEAFQIWKSLFSCAVNVNDDVREDLRRSARALGLSVTSSTDVEEYLFCIQTYFTTLLRLLLAKGSVFCGILAGPMLRDAIGPQPVDGLVELDKRSPGVLRLFEPDAFLWFHDAYHYSTSHALRAQLNTILVAMVDCVDFLDLSVASTDFLRTTYQRLFEPSIRQALGEFYTPEHLVEETLDTAGYSGERGKRLIDFSCGSGGFLIAAIRRKVNKYPHLPPQEVLEDISRCIEGMDIHPLAVAMAKVNYLLAIAPLVRRLVRPHRLTIPIYWGDALMRVRRGQAVHDLVSLHVPGMGTIELPSSAILDWEFLFTSLAATVHSTHTVDEERVFQSLRNKYRDANLELELERGEPHVRKLIAQIVERERRQRDMRWLPLLRNAIFLESRSWQPDQTGTGYDFVVGNPPWVRVHHLSQELKEQLKRFNYRFFTDGSWKWGARLSGGAGFGSQTDYSVVFVERALDLLRPGGVLSFVVTSKVASALYAGGLRSELVRVHRIRALVDYSLHPVLMFEGAKNYPLILTVERSHPDTQPGTHTDHAVSVRIYWPDGTSSDHVRLQGELPVVPNVGPHTFGAPWAIVPEDMYRTIQKMHMSAGAQPRHLGEFPGSPVNMGVKTSTDDVFLVSKLHETSTRDEVVAEFKGMGGKSGNDDRARFRVRLPRNLLRPILRGRSIRPWHIAGQTGEVADASFELLLWPHDDRTGAVFPSERLPPSVQRYFESHRQALTRRSDYDESDPIWTVYRVSPQKLGAKVVWSEMARCMRACYIPQAVSELGGQVPVIPHQTVYLIPVQSDEVGLLLTALLNSSPVRSFFCSFAPRAYTARFRHISWVVSLLPVGSLAPIWSKGLEGLGECTSWVRESVPKLIEISRALHRCAGKDDGLLDELDRWVCRFFGLDDQSDLLAARAYLQKVEALVVDVGQESHEEEEEDVVQVKPVSGSRQRAKVGPRI